MINSDNLRGYNDIFVLAILDRQDSYGYEIIKIIATVSDNVYVMKETTLYSLINRLEKAEYVQSYQGEISKGSRPRTYYTITDKGRAYYQSKCQEWSETKTLVDQFINS